jgi:hypothetical protein
MCCDVLDDTRISLGGGSLYLHISVSVYTSLITSTPCQSGLFPDVTLKGMRTVVRLEGKCYCIICNDLLLDIT